MAFTDWHRAIHQVYQIQEETSNKKIHDQLVVAGMGKTSKASDHGTSTVPSLTLELTVIQPL